MREGVVSRDAMMRKVKPLFMKYLCIVCFIVYCETTVHPQHEASVYSPLPPDWRDQPWQKTRGRVASKALGDRGEKTFREQKWSRLPSRRAPAGSGRGVGQGGEGGQRGVFPRPEGLAQQSAQTTAGNEGGHQQPVQQH